MAKERIAGPGEPTDHRTLYITVTPATHDRMKRLSERTGKPMSWHGRRALIDYLTERRAK